MYKLCMVRLESYKYTNGSVWAFFSKHNAFFRFNLETTAPIKNVLISIQIIYQPSQIVVAEFFFKRTKYDYIFFSSKIWS